MSDLLKSVTPDEIVKAGAMKYFPITGGAIDVGINTDEDLWPYEKCPYCGEPHVFRTVHWPKGEFVSCACQTDSCRKEREDAQVKGYEESIRNKERERAASENFLGRFGVPSGYYHCTLENFTDHAGFTGAKHCIEEARGFVSNPDPMFFITGNTGTGKSHLAVAIIRESVALGMRDILFESVGTLMSKVKGAYGGDGPNEHEVVSRYGRYRLLVLDDLGVENITPNSGSIIQQIVELRVNNKNNKTVITSNFKTAHIEKIYGSRLVSRLMSGKMLSITGTDYRKRR